MLCYSISFGLLILRALNLKVKTLVAGNYVNPKEEKTAIY